MILFCLGAGIVCLSLAARIYHIARQNTDPTMYDQRSQRLQDEIQQLQSDLEKQNNPFYEEQVIRDQLNMQKPDEVVLQLPSPMPSVTHSPLPN